jgi:gas vesicle protein
MGDNLMQGLINGMVGLFSTAWNNLKEFCSNLVSTVSNKASEFKEKGKEIATKLKEGIVNGVPEVIKALVKGVTDAIEKVKEKIATIKEVGKNLAEGLKNGLKEAKDKVVEEAEKLGNDVIDAAKEVFGIHSPSKAFAEIGGFIDKGLIQGLDKYSSNVSDATEELGETAIGSMSGAIAKIADMLNSDMDTQPTITPVLDLTNVVSGIGTINKSLNANRSIELAARTSIASGSLFANNQNGVLVDNSEVVGAIGQLRGDVSSLSQAMSKMKIVMDSGTVVGEIAPQMDKALGARSVYRERWS